MLGKFLGFDRMHENKKDFCFFLREISLKVVKFFLNFFEIVLEIFRRKLNILIPDLYLIV